MSLRRWPEGVSVGVDPSAMGNQARFVNDFREVAIKPNPAVVESRAGKLGGDRELVE